MKDITDYFLSPSKARKSSELADNVTSFQLSHDQNVNTENKIENNSEKLKIHKDEPPKRNKRKRRRKTSDPEVKSVTELLSNNLSLISPNTSGTKTINSPSPLKGAKKAKRKSRENATTSASQEEIKIDGVELRQIIKKKNTNSESLKMEKELNSKEINHTNDEEVNSTTDKIGPEDTEPGVSTPKVNAFQFLMNSRNNVIGQNSNGKTVSDQEINTSEQKSKLKTRKDLFKNWADQKGAQKRNRKEEEIEKCISHKLVERTKRLKKLLQVKPEEKDLKAVKKTVSTVKTKRVVKVLSSSDSESSNDLAKNELRKESDGSNLPVVDLVSEIIEENAQDAVVTISSPSLKKYKGNNQHNLLNFFGVVNPETKEERIEVFEDSPKEPSKELIKIKMFTPESTKKRTSLLSLNRERTKSVTDESSQESVKTKKHKRKKKRHQDTEEQSQCPGQLNDSLEDFCSPTTKKHGTSVKKSKKDKLKRNVHREDAENLKELKEGSLSKGRICENQIITEKSKDKEKCNVLDDEFDEVREKYIDDEEKLQESDKNSTKNTNHIATDESTQDSDIILPQKKRSTKLCVIADDSDDSRSSEGQKNVQEGSESILISKKMREDESTENLDVKKPISNRRTNYVASQENSPVLTPRSRKKLKTRTSKTTENNLDNTLIDELKLENTEPQGRVLRPKKSNLNYSDLFKDQTQANPKPNKKEQSSEKASKKISSKDESIEKVELFSESDSEETVKKKPVKVAAVFLKAAPKPKVDPKVAEARKKFLMSGVPDSLKKTIEKQRSFEDKDCDIFPGISHVQQKCQSKFWDLPKPDIEYASLTSFKPCKEALKFHDLIVRETPYQVNISTGMEKVSHLKSLVDKIKSENPNYPVYKVFRQIHERSGKSFQKEQTKARRSPRRRSKKATRKSSDPVESPRLDTILKDCEMWSEKYKPRSSDEILGNHKSVASLKQWLETWMNYSEEINARGKRKRADSNSETDFESTDCDSRDSTRLPGITMILGGPCGSGKTSAVYAIASELGFNVLELNASSKRTGKRLIQELQEATQSHQVRKDGIHCLTNFINPDKKDPRNKKPEKDIKDDADEKSDQKDRKKMCILLVEDIDLVFEQDEGFLTSLFQLITTSKRPVILTTTDNSPIHVQRLLSQYEYISFMPLSLQCLGLWLQILCLVEGLVVDKDDLGNLLEYNKGDIRKTLLEVQFWSQSGGQLEKNRVLPLKSQHYKSDLRDTDEDLKINLNEEHLKEDYFMNKQCLGSFEVFRENKEFSVPQQFELGLLWWNMPNILNVPSCAEARLHRLQGEQHEDVPEQTKDDVNERDVMQLKSVLGLYDALALTDSLFKTVNYQNSNEPVAKSWFTDVRDSLELTKRIDDRGMYMDMVQELTHTLVNGCIENYRNIEKGSYSLNMALPDTHERRWRAKQHICEDFLKEPIPLSNILDRSSIALDYLPTLRDIARYEGKRAASNTKRGNRFRHYLKNLNMNFNEGTCKLACNFLSLTNRSD